MGLLTIGAAAGLAACQPGSDARRRDAAAEPFIVRTADRGALRIIGPDTLSDSMRVVAVLPEADGEAVAFTFADPVRHISGGLALVDRGADTARLVWPDSVIGASWSGDHRLAFTTRSGPQGVHAVVNVHAEQMEHLESAHDTVRTTVAPPEPPAARGRATAYIDSLRVQPEGAAPAGGLTYTVTRVVPAPGDSLAAFYVVARSASRDERLNPAWYLLDVRSGAVAPLDSVTGVSDDLPEGAAAWAGPRRFVYAMGSRLREATVGRGP